MPDIRDAKDYQLYEDRVNAFLTREQIGFLSTGEDSWFSWRGCEMCGSRLGGMVCLLSAVDANDHQKVTYQICSDCEYYVNYGRLDDVTMMRVRGEQI